MIFEMGFRCGSRIATEIELREKERQVYRKTQDVFNEQQQKHNLSKRIVSLKCVVLNSYCGEHDLTH